MSCSEAVGRPMEILYVEDSLTAARLTVASIRKLKFQYRLTWLRDGRDALEFLYRQGKYSRAPRPDLILLDLGLPKKDGREVLAEIKADESLRDIPVVIVTSSTEEEDVARSKLLEVEAYMIKPIDYEQFLHLITDLSRFWREDMVLPSRD